MSQVFSADSVNLAATLPITANTVTPVLTGNFVNPPFQNAKAIVMASICIVPGTATASVTLWIRRNPNAENFLVATVAPSGVAATEYMFPVTAADSIPDGRAVQYGLTIQQNSASGNGSVLSANITTLLISG